MIRVHYGTTNGLACGTRPYYKSSERFLVRKSVSSKDIRYVTCLRCKATREYFAVRYPQADVETHES